MRQTNKFYLLAGCALLIMTLANCKKDPEFKTDEPEQPKYDATVYNINKGSFPAPDFHENIPTVQGVVLGRMLFYEKMLSRDGSQACASCHIQAYGFTDTATFSKGVEGKHGRRQAMSVFNTAWHTNEFFWDGRAHLLRDQSLMPIQDPLEMNEKLENVVSKLTGSQKYKDQFVRAFGSDEINAEKISLALEQFMNTIVSNQSKYDRYLAGETSLSPSEERGRELFFTEFNEFIPEASGADCAHCHSGFNFSNNMYMNNGLDEDGVSQDMGREDATQKAGDRGKFKVPSLRNIALTAPYMHDGRFRTLEEVVDHYNNEIKKSKTLDPALLPTTNTGLRLTPQDKTDLIAFLHTLTDEKLITNPEYSDPN